MSRIRFATATDVYAAFATAAQDIRVDAEEVPPLRFAQTLAASDKPDAAIAFMAYLLPRREAVWWTCQAVRFLLPGLPPEESQRVAAAEAWVQEPSESRQRMALRIAADADKRLPGVWCAMAAGWSGGNISPIDDQPKAAEPQMTPKAVNAALAVALGQVDPLKRTELLRKVVAAGVTFAEGGPLKF